MLSDLHELLVESLFLEKVLWHFSANILFPQLSHRPLSRGVIVELPHVHLHAPVAVLSVDTIPAEALSIDTRIHSLEFAPIPLFRAVALELLLEHLFFVHKKTLDRFEAALVPEHLILFAFIRGVVLFRLLLSLLFSLLLAFGQFLELDIHFEDLGLKRTDGAFDLVFDTKGAGFIEPVCCHPLYLFELLDLVEQRVTRRIQDRLVLVVDLHEQFLTRGEILLIFALLFERVLLSFDASPLDRHHELGAALALRAPFATPFALGRASGRRATPRSTRRALFLRTHGFGALALIAGFLRFFFGFLLLFFRLFLIFTTTRLLSAPRGVRRFRAERAAKLAVLPRELGHVLDGLLQLVLHLVDTGLQSCFLFVGFLFRGLPVRGATGGFTAALLFVGKPLLVRVIGVTHGLDDRLVFQTCYSTACLAVALGTELACESPPQVHTNSGSILSEGRHGAAVIGCLVPHFVFEVILDKWAMVGGSLSRRTTSTGACHGTCGSAAISRILALFFVSFVSIFLSVAEVLCHSLDNVMNLLDIT